MAACVEVESVVPPADSVGSLEKVKSVFADLLSAPAWSEQVEFLSLDAEGLTVQVGSLFARDWIQENYLARLTEFCRQETGGEGTVRFVVRATAPTQQSRAPSTSDRVIPAHMEPSQPAPTHKVIELKSLNPKYRFGSFVVGNSNQFAHAAAMAVAQKPSETYNPLFIYGDVGLGKTHLMHAIGQEILKNNPATRILYVSSEKFVNEVIHSIRSGRMHEFRHRYRESCDILLMDDVQFIAGKDRSQEEFFHTFNVLHEMHKQIVLSSDRPPKDIQEMEGRVRSRLEWGLIVDIQPPDLETRVAILSKKARDNHINLPDEVALFLATHVKSNVRELEGSLIRVNAFASLQGRPITVEFARDTLKNVLGGVGKVLTMDQIQKIVSEFYGINLTELTGKCRVKTLALPRQIAMYLCRKLTKASFPEIGTKFGGKDHSTVVHACDKISDKLEGDQQLREQMVSLERQLAH